MDVQTENTDPPPCESQSSGKIRKGFKLFGKRKPGNIFSIRSKGDGNNKSPVKTGKSPDGLSETTAPDSEQDSDKEKGQEVSQGEREQTDEEPLGEDGVLAAAPARTSISSASSAKSLSFLSILRGGRRGVGDRQVHTMSQPTGRQRRGLKGLFGNVKFKSKEKEDKEDAPPSPLLMSSRANSVEIIKEDLTLTPKSQPRSLDSPETESYDPLKSVTTLDSEATSPSETSGNVSKSNEHVSPLPTSKPPMVPGDNSLSSLLADISSLLTFDSISGGDIMADVEAEWGKASSTFSAVVTEVTPSSTSLFSKPTISSPLTSTSVGPAVNLKPSPVAVPATSSTTSSTTSFTTLTKTTTTSYPIAKPSTIITTLTKSSTLTTQSVKLSSDSTPLSHPSTSTTPVTLTSFSAPKKSSPSTTPKSTLSTTSTTTAAPPYIPPPVVKPPSVSPALTSTVSKLASEISAPPQTSSVSKPSPVATPATAKPPVTHSPPTPVSFIQHPPGKLDSASSVNLQTFTSFKPSLSSFGEPKAPAPESLPKPSPPAPVISSRMTAVSTSTPTSSSVPAALSKPPLTSSPLDLNRTAPSLVNVPDPSSTLTSMTKTQPSSASVPPPFPSTLDKMPPAYKPPPTPVFLDKTPPAPKPTPTPVTNAGFSLPSQTPPAPVHIQVSQSKGPPAPIQTSVSKDLPAPSATQVTQSKAPSPAQIPISVSKDPPTPAQMPISASKDPPTPAQMPASVSKDLPAPVQVPHLKAPSAQTQISVSVSTEVPAHTQIPVSVPKEPPAPARIPISVSKDSPAPPSAPCQIPVSVSTDPPAPVRSQISVSKDAPAQIPVSQTKTPSAPTPAPCPVSSSSPPPSPWQSEGPASAKIRGSEQASVDGKLTSPSSTDAQNESRASLQGTPRDKKTPQVKASGLSKIPVVGGGRVAKLPVRDSQHGDDDASRDPPTPVLEEERPNFNSHDAGSRDKIIDVEVNVPTSKHSQEESQQQKVLTSLPRDSKIPVKHGPSQIPQARETPRTKIPVSKVPVRRVGNKPAASGGSTQMRK